MMERLTFSVNFAKNPPPRSRVINSPFPETINLQSENQMALHTLPGCTHSTPPDQTGVDDSLDCSSSAGCTVHESAPNSAGPGFNDAGGGVWATQFDTSGI